MKLVILRIICGHSYKRLNVAMLLILKNCAKLAALGAHHKNADDGVVALFLMSVLSKNQKELTAKKCAPFKVNLKGGCCVRVCKLRASKAFKNAMTLL